MVDAALKATETPDVEQEAEKILGSAPGSVTIGTLLIAGHDRLNQAGTEGIRYRLSYLCGVLTGGWVQRRPGHRLSSPDTLVAAQTIALDATCKEVLAARSELDMGPKDDDRILRALWTCASC